MFPRPKEVKHIACSRCRERKVKCDGGKPTCRRCQRLGHECQYIQGKKQHGKGEWVQHLGMFNAQPSRTAPTTSPLTHRHTSQLANNAQRNPTIETPDAESAFQPPESSSPYLLLSSSQSESMVLDAGSPFSNSDSLDTCVPPVQYLDSLPIDDEVLDAQMFAFIPSQSWRDASYNSDLITTNAESISSDIGWQMGSEQCCRGEGYGVFDPSTFSSPPMQFTSTTADTADWRPHYMASSPVSHA